MKLNFKKYWAVLPLAIATPFMVHAEEQAKNDDNKTEFDFSTNVTREIEQDLMKATLSSRKEGKSVKELKSEVNGKLNKVMDLIKQYPSIEVRSDGIRTYPNYYTQKNGKRLIEHWIAEGELVLKSKDLESMAKVLEGLEDNITIEDVSFSVSKEKLASLEDEMTLEIIQQFQHKAEIIQKGLNVKKYTLKNVRLDSPSDRAIFSGANYYFAESAITSQRRRDSEEKTSQPMILIPGKQVINANATGTIQFE
jgi:raw score 8.85